MAKAFRTGERSRTTLTKQRKMELSDLITIKRAGNVSLKHDPTRNDWYVMLGYQRAYKYRSSTWAQNKYRRLLVTNGILDDDHPVYEEGELCEKQVRRI